MKKPTLIGELNRIVEETGITVLRAKAHGYEVIVDILFRHGVMGLDGYTCHEQPDPDMPLPYDGPSLTDAQPTINAAPAAPEAPPAAPPVPEAPPVPVPAEDPGATTRRRGRPRKVIAEEAPSLLARPEPPAEPVEANEPAATPEPAAASDDDIPW